MIKNVMLVVASVFALVAMLGALYVTRPPESLKPVESLKSAEGLNPVEDIQTGNTLFTDMLTQIERQSEIETLLLAELDSGAYSFEAPLVIANPYGNSPLTALVLFNSDEPLNISIHVPGKTRLADVDFTFEGFNTIHQIPVCGLYPDTVNAVQLTAITQRGISNSVTLEIQTDPLPPELEKDIIITDVVDADRYQSGVNFTFSKRTAFDSNGEYRWFFYEDSFHENLLYNYNGNIILGKGAKREGDLLLCEISLLGKIINVYYSPYGVHHDIVSIDGKNLLVTGTHGDTSEDFIYEVDVDTGKIANTLDLKHVLQRSRDESVLYTAKDWLHNNAIVYHNGDLVISCRHQGVMRLSWPTGKIMWILSDHAGYNPMFQKYLLDPVGDNFEWPYNQHAPKILDDYDNNPDTMDILLFDNGTGRFTHDKELQRAVANNEVVEPEPYSRMVHYRINEKEKTVQQLWQFGKELGKTYYSEIMGGVNMLSNGNRLGVFPRQTPELIDVNTSVIETDSSGNIIWEAYATSKDSGGTFRAYRLERLPLYNEAANNLRLGVPANNFIPEDKLP